MTVNAYEQYMTILKDHGAEKALEFVVAAGELMDQEIREDLARAIGDCVSEGEFLCLYCARHRERFGEIFQAS